MSFQVGIGSLGGTVFFRWDFVPLCQLCHMIVIYGAHVSNDNIQGLTYLVEKLSLIFTFLQPYVGWIGWKHIAQQLFPAHLGQIISHSYWKQIFIVWNYHFSGPTSIYLFEFNNTNSRIKCEICLKLTIEVSDVILVSLLNIFDTLF